MGRPRKEVVVAKKEEEIHDNNSDANSIETKNKETATEPKKKRVSKPKKRKGNLTHLQKDKDRIVKVSFRNQTNRHDIQNREIKAIDFEVAISYNKDGSEIEGGSVHYVEETYDYFVTDPRRMQGADAYKHETRVKPFPVNEFLKAGIAKFCEYVGEDEWTINPVNMTPSHVFTLMNNIDAKFIESKFAHRLVGGNNYPLVGVHKNKKIAKMIESFSKIRVGNSYICARNILHLPNFNNELTINDI